MTEEPNTQTEEFEGMELTGPKLVIQFSKPLDEEGSTMLVKAEPGFPPYLVAVWLGQLDHRYNMSWQDLHPNQRAALVQDLKVRTEMDRTAMILNEREMAKTKKVLIPGMDGLQFRR